MHSSIVFVAAWGVALTLNLFIDSPISYPITGELVGLLAAVFALIVAIDFFQNKNTNHHSLRIGSKGFIGERLLMVLFLIFLFWSAAYSIFMFPLLKIFGLPAVEYNEFGIPGLQGLVNAIYLSLSTLRIFRIILDRNHGRKISLVEISIILSYPLLMLSRQLLFSLAVQSVLLWWMFYSVSLRAKVASLLVGLVSGVIIFGVLGNIRTGDEVISSFLGSDANTSLSILYWFYVYAASPVSNLSYNLEYSAPDYSVATFLSSLLPTPLRNALGVGQGFDGFSNILLINDNLNMATFFAPGFFSFGWPGMLLSSIVLVLVVYLIKKNISKSAYAMLCYPVIVQVIAFSPFTNLLFYLPVVFQLFIFLLLHCLLRYGGLLITNRSWRYDSK